MDNRFKRISAIVVSIIFTISIFTLNIAAQGTSEGELQQENYAVINASNENSKIILREDFQSFTEGEDVGNMLKNSPNLNDSVSVVETNGNLKTSLFDSAQKDWQKVDVTLTSKANTTASITYKLSTEIAGGFSNIVMFYTGRCINNSKIKISSGADIANLTVVKEYPEDKSFYDNYEVVSFSGNNANELYVKIEINSIDFTWACLQDLTISGYYADIEPIAEVNEPLLADGLTPYNIISNDIFNESFDDFYYKTPPKIKQNEIVKFDGDLLRGLDTGNSIVEYSGKFAVMPLDTDYKEVMGIIALDGDQSSFTIKLTSKQASGFQNLWISTTGRSIMTGSGAIKFEVGDNINSITDTVWSHTDGDNFLPSIGGKLKTIDLSDRAKGKNEMYLKVTLKQAGYPGWVFLDSLKVTELVENQNATVDTWKYNYHQDVAKWANATTKNGSKYVWIPRYSYKLDADNKKINIKFSKGLTDYIDDGYVVHPAFSHKGKQLTGYWAGKFEAGMENGTVVTGANNEGTGATDRTWTSYVNYDGTPVVTDWISAYENASVNIKINQELGADADSHMLKNSEWEGVSYLSHSMGMIPKSSLGTAQTLSEAYVVNTQQSTTNNASGIYGMSGGVAEFVGAHISDGLAPKLAGKQLVEKNGDIIDTYTVNDFSSAKTSMWNTATYIGPTTSNGPFMTKGASNASLATGGPAQGLFATQVENEAAITFVGYRPAIAVEKSIIYDAPIFSSGTQFPTTGTLTVEMNVMELESNVSKLMILSIYEKGTNELVKTGFYRPENIQIGNNIKYSVTVDGLPTTNTDKYYAKVFMWKNLLECATTINPTILGV